jgi:uncharacterized protein YdaU (DUF1376 family)
VNLPRMSLHIGDYLKDTRHLRALEHGAYFLLIMHYWTKGGLPDDDRQLSAIACMSDKEWKKARPTIEAFFTAGWRHKRIDQELADATERYERRVAAGRKGGVAKAQHSSSNARPMPPAMPKQPITLTQKEDSEAKASGADAPDDPSIAERDFFKRGREILGDGAGGQLARLLKAKGNNVALARSAIELAATKERPAEFVAAMCLGRKSAQPKTLKEQKSQDWHDARQKLREYAYGDQDGDTGGGSPVRLLPPIGGE